MESPPAVVAHDASVIPHSPATIRARPKPDEMMDDDEWADEQDQLIEIEQRRYDEGRAGGGGGGAVVTAQNANRFAPLQEALVKEFALYDEHRFDVIRASEQVPKVLTYGDPLELNHPRRYEYWPEMQARLPLVYQAARIILCARTHLMGNERDHSVMGRLFSKAKAT